MHESLSAFKKKINQKLCTLVNQYVCSQKFSVNLTVSFFYNDIETIFIYHIPLKKSFLQIAVHKQLFFYPYRRSPNNVYTILQEKPADFPDLSPAYRKCNSQFTDTADYRRPGRNTWQDESGVYANTHYKRQVMQPSNPIPPTLS